MAAVEIAESRSDPEISRTESQSQSEHARSEEINGYHDGSMNGVHLNGYPPSTSRGINGSQSNVNGSSTVSAELMNGTQSSDYPMDEAPRSRDYPHSQAESDPENRFAGRARRGSGGRHHAESERIPSLHATTDEWSHVPIGDESESLDEHIRSRGMRSLINDTPRMNLVLSFLTLSQILSVMVVERSAKRAVKRFFHTLDTLNFSEFYGVIGSQTIDQTFYTLIESFTNVRHLSFRFCTQLKGQHLERILQKICPGDSEYNEQLETLDLFFCSKLTEKALFKIAKRLPNLKSLNLGRCHLVTSPSNINGLKHLLHLPLEYFAFSLNPEMTVNDAIEIVSLLIHDDSFRNLKTLDLRHGCELFENEHVDLDDLYERGFDIKLPANRRHRRSR